MDEKELENFQKLVGRKIESVWTRMDKYGCIEVEIHLDNDDIFQINYFRADGYGDISSPSSFFGDVVS